MPTVGCYISGRSAYIDVSFLLLSLDRRDLPTIFPRYVFPTSSPTCANLDVILSLPLLGPLALPCLIHLRDLCHTCIPVALSSAFGQTLMECPICPQK